ncbi:DUF2905 domain-containing protein [Virgibacillus sp. NKC19-16]|uniref:DUF2905 domain-containing protein n=1 Tax=Virgibacillus salidurans TaxID=2831673 RepID=UPI001F3FD1CB|nr:DUF2905 domain-containing protein [Virgibacillus sp. NKC19-16]UJL44951.1 DUF2905 domain-containing protein [Virgibacillus sp. NKC19-16]
MNIGKLFIILGIALVIIGVIWTFIGRLPGDISFRKGDFSFHFPIMTSIVVSIILTLTFFIIGRFR